MPQKRPYKGPKSNQYERRSPRARIRQWYGVGYGFDASGRPMPDHIKIATVPSNGEATLAVHTARRMRAAQGLPDFDITLLGVVRWPDGAVHYPNAFYRFIPGNGMWKMRRDYDWNRRHGLDIDGNLLVEPDDDFTA